jgi:hypothetical protein
VIRRIFFGAQIGLVLLCQTIEAQAPPSPADELREVCRQLQASDENYFGRAPAQEMRRRLGEPFEEVGERASLQLRYGRELLELGEPLEAIRVFEGTLQQAASLEPWEVAWLFRNLGLAHLQVSEDIHCLEGHNAESCILPIRGSGVHSRPEHARVAIRVFQQLLKGDPNDSEVAWLLNLAAMVSGDHPQAVPERYRADPARLGSPEGERAWRDRAPELGVDATDLAGGAVMDDFDGDGLLDLISTTSDPCGGMKAFRNDGQGGFEDVAEAWGLDEQLGGLNLVHADYDGDGRLDLLVLRGAWLGEHGKIRNSLLRNQLGETRGRFVDTTRRAGIAEPAAPTQTAAWADFDLDGDLDLYVGNETSDEAPAGSQLFRNNGDGTFSDIAPSAGVTNDRYAKGVVWGDYDDDGDPDLFVSNIGPNRLYRNRGDGTFVDVAAQLGVTEPEGRSFTSWFFDYDNDGDLDLFVSDYSIPTKAVAGYYLGGGPVGGQPRVYRNEGGSFVESSRELGLEMPVLVMGANHGDLDNDGFEDIYLGTGDPEFETLFPNLVLGNVAGRGYQEQTDAFRMGHLQKGHGVAFGDLDNDGDQDLFHQLGGFYPGDDYGNALFENPGSGNQWITLRLEGAGANHFALGARVTLRVRRGDETWNIHRLVGSGGSFGGSSLQQEIGLGEAEEILELIVSWPGTGLEQRWTEIERRAIYRVVEGSETLERWQPGQSSARPPGE